MDTLILLTIFISLALGFYRLKKHSDKVRKEMIEEMEDTSDHFTEWEDQESDVNTK